MQSINQSIKLDLGRCLASWSFQQLTIIGHFDLPHVLMQVDNEFQVLWGQGASELCNHIARSREQPFS